MLCWCCVSCIPKAKKKLCLLVVRCVCLHSVFPFDFKEKQGKAFLPFPRCGTVLLLMVCGVPQTSCTNCLFVFVCFAFSTLILKSWQTAWADFTKTSGWLRCKAQPLWPRCPVVSVSVLTQCGLSPFWCQVFSTFKKGSFESWIFKATLSNNLIFPWLPYYSVIPPFGNITSNDDIKKKGVCVGAVFKNSLERLREWIWTKC